MERYVKVSLADLEFVFVVSSTAKAASSTLFRP
jgi:hypothetical protein